MAMPWPTVAECTHAMGLIMFYCGRERSSGVAEAFLPSHTLKFVTKTGPKRAQTTPPSPGTRATPTTVGA
jgi:hypothetical protein